MNHTVFTSDDYEIFDKIATRQLDSSSKERNSVLGWVQILLNKKKIFEGPNLVVSQGREFVAQKIFDILETEDGDRPNFKTSVISHFAIGSGGCDVTNEEYVLTGPYICDKSLYKPIGLGNTAYLHEPSNYVGDAPYKTYKNAVKPVRSGGGSIILEGKSYSGNSVTCENYTKVKCTCIINQGEPADMNAGQAVAVNEAGLYFVNLDQQPRLFSHITFPTKFIALEDELIIYWYILC